MICGLQSFDAQLRQLSIVENASSPGFQYDLFMAHSLQDTDVVQQFCHHLHGTGFTTWTYDDIRAGEPVYLSICAAMCRSRRCLLLLTPSFVNSPFFHVELNDALDRQCRLGLIFCLPVYHNLDPDLRPYQLRDMPGLDYNSEDFWPKLESAIKSKYSLYLHNNTTKCLQSCFCLLLVFTCLAVKSAVRSLKPLDGCHEDL